MAPDARRRDRGDRQRDPDGSRRPPAGYGLDYTALPWLRAQEAVRSGEADALFTIPTADRRSYAVFTPSPLVRYPFALVYLKDGPNSAALDRADTIEALTRFDYVYDQFDKTQTARAAAFGQSQPSPGDGPMLREVASGRGDFTVVNAIRIRRAIESYPDAEAIIARIDAAARAATADGAIRAILAAHL